MLAAIAGVVVVLLVVIPPEGVFHLLDVAAVLTRKLLVHLASRTLSEAPLSSSTFRVAGLGLSSLVFSRTKAIGLKCFCLTFFF